MFSQSVKSVVILAITGVGAIASANDKPTQPVVAGALSAPDAAAAALDSERYVQTELDWRSYYLNRMPAQGRARVWGQVPGRHAADGIVDPAATTP